MSNLMTCGELSLLISTEHHNRKIVTTLFPIINTENELQNRNSNEQSPWEI